MSGAKRAPSSSVKNATAIGRRGARRRASISVSMHLEAGQHAEVAVEAAAGARRCRCAMPVITGAPARSAPASVPTTLPISSIVDVEPEVAHPASRRGRGPARSSSVSAEAARSRRPSIGADLGQRVEPGAQARQRDAERRRTVAVIGPSCRPDRAMSSGRHRHAGEGGRWRRGWRPTTAGVDEIVGGSPTPLAPNGAPGSGSSISVASTVGQVERGGDQVVGEARVADAAVVDDELLHHRQPDALGDAALDLADQPAAG